MNAKLLIVGLVLISSAASADQWNINRFGTNGWSQTNGNITRNNGGIRYNSTTFGTGGVEFSDGSIDRQGNVHVFTWGTNGAEFTDGYIQAPPVYGQPYGNPYGYGDRW